MNTRFRIEVSPEPCGDSGRAIFIVEAASGRLRIDEVRLVPGALGIELPPELGELDFHGCVSMATILSAGTPPTTDAGKAVVEEPSEGSSAQVSLARSAEESAVARREPVGVLSMADRPSSGPPSDLARVYWRVDGSIAKVAKHYDVPRQIARDWISNLRNENAIPRR